MAPSGEFTKSRGPEDAQLTQRMEPHSTIGPFLSVRALAFESLHGLDIWVTSTQDPKLPVWVTACLTQAENVVLIQRSKTITIEKSQQVPPGAHAGGTLLLQAGKTLCAQESKSTLWQLIPCSRHVNSDTECFG